MGLVLLLGCGPVLYSACWETFQSLYFPCKDRACNVHCPNHSAAQPSLSVRLSPQRAPMGCEAGFTPTSEVQRESMQRKCY